MNPRALLRSMFDAAVASAQPALCVPPHLPAPVARRRAPGRHRCRQGVGGDGARGRGPLARTLAGLVVTRYGYAVPCERSRSSRRRIRSPTPPALARAERILDLVQGLGADDLVLCLISGGGSALLSLPAPGSTLEDKQQSTGPARFGRDDRRDELRAPARLGDQGRPARRGLPSGARPDAADLRRSRRRPVDIASGPTVADPTTCADALDIVRRYGIELPPALRELLESGRGESMKPGDPRLRAQEMRIVAAPQIALEAAAAVARARGLRRAHPRRFDRRRGERRRQGAGGHRAPGRRARGQPFAPPCILLSGGETTVTVRGQGRGGRNVEFLLSLAIALDGQPGIHALAATPTASTARRRRPAPACRPTRSRAPGHSACGRRTVSPTTTATASSQALGDALVTGPTLTNVNDFRAILIDPPAGA